MTEELLFRRNTSLSSYPKVWFPEAWFPEAWFPEVYFSVQRLSRVLLVGLLLSQRFQPLETWANCNGEEERLSPHNSCNKTHALNNILVPIRRCLWAPLGIIYSIWHTISSRFEAESQLVAVWQRDKAAVISYWWPLELTTGSLT